MVVAENKQLQKRYKNEETRQIRERQVQGWKRYKQSKPMIIQYRKILSCQEYDIFLR